MLGSPAVEQDVAQVSTLDVAASMSVWNEMTGNYSSVAENEDQVAAELKKERAKGFLKWAPVENKLGKSRGRLVLPRVGAVVTWKGGETKATTDPRPSAQPRFQAASGNARSAVYRAKGRDGAAE